MGNEGTLRVKVVGDIADFQSKMSGAQKVLVGFGVSAGAAAIAGLRMGDDYDDAADSIRTATGKTGAALAGLEQSFRNVAGRVKEDIGLTSAVLGELHSRTGLTGQALEDMTVKVIEFSRVTGTDATANVALVTRLFGDWSIATEDQAAVMDKLLRASQETGLGVDRLMQTVVQFGAPLRLLGFSMEESIALLGKWEEEGVNTEQMLQGLKFSVKSLAQEGVPASAMAETLRAKIEAIGKSADPVADSIKLFGLRAGPDLAAAILEGRFSIDDLMKVIEDGSETVRSAADDTRDFGDGFAELKNKITTALGPILDDFAGLADAMGNAIYLLPVLGGGLAKVTLALWAKVAALAAAQGGWITMLAAMGPAVLVFAAVVGGIIAINAANDELIKRVDAARLKLRELAETAALTPEQLGQLQTGGEFAEHLGNALGFLAPVFKSSGEQVAALGEEAQAVAQGMPPAFEGAGKEIRSLLKTNLAPIPGEMAETGAAAASSFGSAMSEEGRQEMARVRDQFEAQSIAAGRVAIRGLAGGLLDSLPTMHDAWQAFKDQQKNMLDPMKEIAWIEAKLSGGKLAAGLESTNPLQREASQQMRDTLMSQLLDLKSLMGKVGDDAGDALGSGAVKNLRAWQSEWFKTLHGMAQTAATLLKTHSPAKAGPWSEDGGPGEWMHRLGRTMKEKLQAGLGEGGPIVPPKLPDMSGALGRLGRTLGIAQPAGGLTPAYAGAPITVYAYGSQPDDVERQIVRAQRRSALRASLQGSIGRADI